MSYVTVRKILMPIFRSKLSAVSGQTHVPVNGPYIIAANHIDFLDGFFVAMAVYQIHGHPVYFLTKSNNYWWTQATIPIDPDRRAQSIDDALGYLRAGKVICSFIEGGRNRENYLPRGKTGVARLALQAQVPVVPIGISGPSGKNFAHSLTNLITERENVTIAIGQPVELSDLYSQPTNQAAVIQATDRIMRSLSKLTGKPYPGNNA